MIATPPAPPTPPNPDDDSPRRGRPTKLTAAMIQKAAALTLQGHYRGVIAKALGVSIATFRRWLEFGEQYPDGLYGDLLRAVNMADAANEQRVIGGIIAAGQLDARFLCWYAERKWPLRWGKPRIDLADFNRRLNELKREIRETKDDVDAAGIADDKAAYQGSEDEP